MPGERTDLSNTCAHCSCAYNSDLHAASLVRLRSPAVVHTSLYWFISFIALGVLILLLRWAYSRGHSLVSSPAKAGKESEYGLLVPVAAPETFIEGEIWRQQLQDAGIRASLTTTLDGPRLMVFPQDHKRALKLLNN